MKATRHPGLDWLRLAATLGVLTLHAGIAYMPHPLPGLRWATHDQTTPLADAVCWTLDAWVMPVFFLLGGSAAAGLLAAFGSGGMARHRLRRLGGPLLLGCVLILPLDLYAWLIGDVLDGELPLRKLRSLKLSGHDDGLWGPSHLWFLQYLLIYCLVGCGLAAWTRPSLRIRTAASRRRRRMAAAAGLFAVSAASLWIKPRILIGFDHQPLPQPANLAFFATFFAAGWHLPSAVWTRRQSGATVLLGLASLLLYWPAVRSTFDGTGSLVAAVGFTAACWGLGLGSLQFARTLAQPLTPVAQRMLAAAFWIYLLHHPVVGLMQVALKRTAIDPNLKFAIVAVVGLCVPLATYRWLVRGRWIGRVLGEKPAVESRPQRQAAA